jgi:hypothetical protein
LKFVRKIWELDEGPDGYDASDDAGGETGASVVAAYAAADVVAAAAACGAAVVVNEVLFEVGGNLSRCCLKYLGWSQSGLTPWIPSRRESSSSGELRETKEEPFELPCHDLVHHHDLDLGVSKYTLLLLLDQSFEINHYLM